MRLTSEVGCSSGGKLLEALMIAELLGHDEPTPLRTLWSTKFPESELERLAVALGYSFD